MARIRPLRTVVKDCIMALLVGLLFGLLLAFTGAMAQAQVRPSAPDTVADSTRGQLLRHLDGAPRMSDSAYTADTAAIVAGLWKHKVGGKEWRLVPVMLVAGMLDRDGGGYRSSYRGAGPHPQDRLLAPDKRDHAYLGAVTALAVDRRTFAWRGVLVACVGGAAFEVGQMRPARFPRPSSNDRLGYGDARDAVCNCGGAIAAVSGRALYRRLTRD